MERENGAVRGIPARSARPLGAIQPHVAGAELRLFERSIEGERLARIAADQELLLKLSVEGFYGEAWREVADALVAYGHTVMRAWISSGVVFRKCRDLGLGGDTLRMPAGGIPPQEAEELALDTVGEAIVYFRGRVLSGGIWDPARGASMTTFFVGACLLRFPNEFRRWWRWWNQRQAQHPVETALADEAFPAPDDEVLEREALRQLLAGFDRRTAEVAYLRMQGFSTTEIAELVGTSYKSVEMVLYRLRGKLKQERAG
jgi:DNA-binding CsgD family transcriptional regulator